jgi:hypothetical protein
MTLATPSLRLYSPRLDLDSYASMPSIDLILDTIYVARSFNLCLLPDWIDIEPMQRATSCGDGKDTVWRLQFASRMMRNCNGLARMPNQNLHSTWLPPNPHGQKEEDKDVDGLDLRDRVLMPVFRYPQPN